MSEEIKGKVHHVENLLTEIFVQYKIFVSDNHGIKPDFIVMNEIDWQKVYVNNEPHFILYDNEKCIFGMKVYRTLDIEQNQFRLGVSPL